MDTRRLGDCADSSPADLAAIDVFLRGGNKFVACLTRRKIEV